MTLLVGGKDNMVNKHNFKIPKSKKLYSLTYIDLRKALVILGKAFKKDPVWGAISKEDSALFYITFGMFLKYAFKYGKIYSLTNELNEIAILIPSRYAKKSFYRLLRCGAIIEVLSLIKRGIKLKKIFSELEKDQSTYMKNPCIYLNGL